jgi:hypothetical protein
MQLEKILFLDIETAPQTENFSTMDTTLAHLWEEKMEQMKSQNSRRYRYDCHRESYTRRLHYLPNSKNCLHSVVTSTSKTTSNNFVKNHSYGTDESTDTHDFANILNKAYYTETVSLCGHNAKEFDSRSLQEEC